MRPTPIFLSIVVFMICRAMGQPITHPSLPPITHPFLPPTGVQWPSGWAQAVMCLMALGQIVAPMVGQQSQLVEPHVQYWLELQTGDLQYGWPEEIGAVCDRVLKKDGPLRKEFLNQVGEHYSAANTQIWANEQKAAYDIHTACHYLYPMDETQRVAPTHYFLPRPSN